MLRALSVALCLMLPGAAFAEDPAPPPPASSDAPAVTPDLAPPNDANAAAPQQAVENARWCGAHGGCSGHGGAGKWILAGGIAGTVLTAVAVGVAVSVATHHNANTPVTP